MIKLLQILPRVPPAVCGIADHAWCLARALQEQHGIESTFLAAGTSSAINSTHQEFTVDVLQERSSRALLDYLDEHADDYQAILLHISPYGYQKRGVPLWLASALRRFSARAKRPILISMFHELYASGPITSSSYWLKGMQKMVLRKIAQASDILRTNREIYATWLRAVPGLHAPAVRVMPVFSGMGEMAVPPPLSGRESAMVLFATGMHGGADATSTLMTCAKLCRKFGLDCLKVVGGAAPAEDTIEGINLQHLRYLPSEDATTFFSACRMAYSAYHPLYLGKSSLLAAYAAHGLVVITRSSQDILPDGLQMGRHLLNEQTCLNGDVPGTTDLEMIAQNLHAWYAEHSLSRQALSYAEDIRDTPAGQLQTIPPPC